MIIKAVYILIFAITDLIIWFILNKPGAFNRKLRYLLAVLFALFIVLHAGMIKSELLLPWRAFFSVIVVTCAPVLLYAWYTGLLARRKSRNITETKFGTGVIKVTNVVFIYLVNIAALIMQILMIIGYYPDKM